MLPDPDAQRRERVLFTLRLDHHVLLLAVEGGAQRLQVAGFYRVGVRPALLRGVLARDLARAGLAGPLVAPLAGARARGGEEACTDAAPDGLEGLLDCGFAEYFEPFTGGL